jgi:hypothetical protein
MADPYHRQVQPSSADATDMSSTESFAQRALADFVQIQGAQGIAAELLSAAAANTLTPSDLRQRLDGLEPGMRGEIEDVILDAVLFAIERTLADHRITPAEQEALSQAKRALGVAEGALYTRRADRVSQMMDAEMRRLLADRAVDPNEALQLVELQEAFDLGYDAFLALTQPNARRLVDEIITDIVADGVVTREERDRLEAQIRALDTAYTLTAAQRTRLGEAGLRL